MFEAAVVDLVLVCIGDVRANYGVLGLDELRL